MSKLLSFAKFYKQTPSTTRSVSVNLFLDSLPYGGMVGFLYANDPYIKHHSLDNWAKYVGFWTVSGILYPNTVPLYTYIKYSKKN